MLIGGLYFWPPRNHHDDKDLLINGRPVNLRLTHDGGGFPPHGIAADGCRVVEQIIQTCKDYGLNGCVSIRGVRRKPRLRRRRNGFLSPARMRPVVGFWAAR